MHIYSVLKREYSPLALRPSKTLCRSPANPCSLLTSLPFLYVSNKEPGAREDSIRSAQIRRGVRVTREREPSPFQPHKRPQAIHFLM